MRHVQLSDVTLLTNKPHSRLSADSIELQSASGIEVPARPSQTMFRFLTSPFRNHSPVSDKDESSGDVDVDVVGDDNETDDGGVSNGQDMDRTPDKPSHSERAPEMVIKKEKHQIKKEKVDDEEEKAGDPPDSPGKESRSSKGSVVSLMTTSSDDSFDGPDPRQKQRAAVRSKTGIVVKTEQPLPRGTLYERTEDEKILQYVAHDRDTVMRVKGRLFWLEAERDCASGYRRTWQSLKNRFFKSIVPHLSDFDCISARQRQAIAQYLHLPAPSH